MGTVRFVLDKALEKLDITANRLAVESKIRPNSIYDLLENDKKTISLEHLSAIINALNSIAKEKGIRAHFDINDVLEYVDTYR